MWECHCISAELAADVNYFRVHCELTKHSTFNLISLQVIRPNVLVTLDI